MNGYWANLRPFEKRVLVGVAALFFVVLNTVRVPVLQGVGPGAGPDFQATAEAGPLSERRCRRPILTRGRSAELESEGLEVPLEDQARHFANTINVQAGQSGVQIISYGKTHFTTNQFFIELSQTISAQSPEEPLVDFLYNLGSGNSLIRVRDLNLRPDPARQQIVATITLVASYQKQAAAKTGLRRSAPKGPAAPGTSKAAPLADAAAKSITSTKK